MQPTGAVEDRRNLKRFQVKKRTIVLIDAAHDGELGELLDISATGLSFKHYLTWEEAAKELQTLDILLADNSFIIPQIVYRYVSEIEINTQVSQSPSAVIKRRSVEFVDLSQDQKEMLDFFIQNHT